jgi:hypothetical protein
VWGAAGFAASLLLGIGLSPYRDGIGLENVVVLYLVVVVAAAGGRAAGFVSALSAVLAYDYWFTTPLGCSELFVVAAHGRVANGELGSPGASCRLSRSQTLAMDCVGGGLADNSRGVAEQESDELAGMVARRFDGGNAASDSQRDPRSWVGECSSEAGDG